MKAESDYTLKRKTFLDGFLNDMKTGKYDYIDSYEFVIVDKNNKISITDIAEVFIQPGPKWFEGLFALRNKIAALLGLKTQKTILNESDPNRWEPGTQTPRFKVFGKTDTEIVLGEDDKHLDLRISLLLKQDIQNTQKKGIVVTTVVKLHNRLGRYYFFFIKPIHCCIVPLIMRQKFKQLEAK